tara:strand:- start:163 stop:633 length:471 start_codon:yes stop_codon:yes gene_type:complete
MNEDEKWMALALEQAKKAEKHSEVPVGAILVKDGLLVAKAHNQSISTNDPTAHAEIELLRESGSLLKNYRLKGTELYVTLEPCMMCLSAILQARVSKVFFGAYDYKMGACGSCEDFKSLNCFNHDIKVEGGVLERECKNILQSFFQSRRFLSKKNQ